jgi:hypothetical protein
MTIDGFLVDDVDLLLFDTARADTLQFTISHTHTHISALSLSLSLSLSYGSSDITQLRGWED